VVGVAALAALGHRQLGLEAAFANDLPKHGTSGVIFVGATDDGRPASLTVDDRPPPAAAP
jgi:hypothetical protein